MQHRTVKILAALSWLSLLGLAYAWGQAQGFGMLDLARVTYEHIARHPYAPVAYIVIYTLRPLIFFPAMWLTILSGSLFGFWGAVVYTIIGQNLSASLAYVLGRFFANGDGEHGTQQGLLGRWRALLDEQAFTSVLILRVIYAPFDLVSYGCGLLSVPWAAYTLATLIGILPGLITFASFGAALDFSEFHYDHFSLGQLIDARQLAISGGLLAFSLVLAWILHRRHQQRIAIGADT